MRLQCAMLIALASCGKGDDGDGSGGAFNVDSYCQNTADCYNEFYAKYAADTGNPFVYDKETCVTQWESQRETYAQYGCESTYQLLEDCIADAEHLVCVRGSYGSGDCVVEAQDVAECVTEAIQ